MFVASESIENCDFRFVRMAGVCQWVCVCVCGFVLCFVSKFKI